MVRLVRKNVTDRNELEIKFEHASRGSHVPSRQAGVGLKVFRPWLESEPFARCEREGGDRTRWVC